jgi:GxxExxY protein
MALLFPVGAETSDRVIGAAIRVHRALGPGLLESAYQACLAHELALDGHKVETEVEIPVVYRGIEVKAGFRADLIVDSLILIEIKSVAKLIPIHDAQVITYLRLTGIRTGLLLNFNVEVLRHGLRRLLK